MGDAPSVQSTRNVTPDPLAPAEAVADPEVREVIDLATGEYRNAYSLISAHPYGEAVTLRVRVREAFGRGAPAYRCADCFAPVYISAQMTKRLFFKHPPGTGRCRERLLISGPTAEEIRTRKFHGLRESEAHKHMKALIERSLRADPAFTLDQILVERRWAASDGPEKWRQPDVQATTANMRYAFEAQLSTTFLSVIVDRRSFYRDQKAMLVWILPRFDPDYRRMTVDDLLFSNNSNVFVVDNETVRISEEKKAFHLRCHFRRPAIEDGNIIDGWEEVIAPLAALTADVKEQRLYHFDFDAEFARLKSKQDEALRLAFKDFWIANVNPRFIATNDSLADWAWLQVEFGLRKVLLPPLPTDDGGFRTLINAVMSAELGKPIGWQFEKLVQCAHQLFQAHPENLLAFGYELKASGHDKTLQEQDTSGRWKRRAELVGEALRNGDPRYMPDPTWLPVLTFLFPSAGTSVERFLRDRGDALS